MEELHLRPIKLIDPSSYQYRLFFGLGNREIQNQLRLLGYDESKIDQLLHVGIKTGSLLSDLLIQPTAHYCVPQTRQVALDNEEIFKAGHGIYALSSTVETYQEDLRIKQNEYPSRKDIFQNEELVKQIINELESFGVRMYRKGSVGELTGTQWKDAFTEKNQSEENDIVKRIENSRSIGSKEKLRLLQFLPTLPEIRGSQAFDWDYISGRLKEHNIQLSPLIQGELQKLLLRCYLSSCKRLYDCELIGEPIASSQRISWTGRIERYDIQLFLDFTKALRVHEIMLRLSASDIVDIKEQFDSFPKFREEYFEIIDRAKYVEQQTLEFVREELRGERGTEAAQIRRILEGAEPLLVESARELGIPKDPSLLYFPKDSPIYLFKKAFVDYENMPFIRFKDELIWCFGKKLQNKAQEAVYEMAGRTYPSTYHAKEAVKISPVPLSPMIEKALSKVLHNIKRLVPKADSPTRDNELEVITAVLNYAAQELVDPSFRDAEVTERQFQKDITRYLQLVFGLPSVLREVRVSRGYVDVLVLGVPLELKVAKKRGNLSEFVESSLPQVTEYIVGRCCKVGLLCVLDISKQSRARPSLIDNVSVYEGKTDEGVDSSHEGTVVVVAVVIRGALSPASRLRSQPADS